MGKFTEFLENMDRRTFLGAAAGSVLGMNMTQAAPTEQPKVIIPDFTQLSEEKLRFVPIEISFISSGNKNKDAITALKAISVHVDAELADKLQEYLGNQYKKVRYQWAGMVDNQPIAGNQNATKLVANNLDYTKEGSPGSPVKLKLYAQMKYYDVSEGKPNLIVNIARWLWQLSSPK